MLLRLPLLLLCFLGFGPAWLAHDLQARETLPVVPLFGDRYVPLDRWASAKGFSFRWDKAGKTVSATNRWAKLLFSVNSKKASINGLTIWLSNPVQPSGTSVYISERDVLKTLHPILYPDKLPKGRAIRTVMIAAGHGGRDPGYQLNKEQEKKYTLLMAKAVREALIASGFKVQMTRESDVYIHPEQQATLANRAQADLFITLHYNASSEITPAGVETFCLTPAGALSTNGGAPSPRSPGNSQDPFNVHLAYQVQKSILANSGFADRGLRRAGFLVLREITMPGILIEGGFLSNPADAKKILSATHRKTMARAIADGVLAFKRLVERK